MRPNFLTIDDLHEIQKRFRIYEIKRDRGGWMPFGHSDHVPAQKYRARYPDELERKIAQEAPMSLAEMSEHVPSLIYTIKVYRKALENVCDELRIDRAARANRIRMAVKDVSIDELLEKAKSTGDF